MEEEEEEEEEKEEEEDAWSLCTSSDAGALPTIRINDLPREFNS